MEVLLPNDKARYLRALDYHELQVGYIEKDAPQPQPDVAFGLFT